MQEAAAVIPEPAPSRDDREMNDFASRKRSVSYLARPGEAGRLGKGDHVNLRGQRPRTDVVTLETQTRRHASYVTFRFYTSEHRVGRNSPSVSLVCFSAVSGHFR